MNCFHLAIPSNNIKETKDFYSKLGYEFGRESEEFLIMNFHGHQVVFHKSDETPELEMYPRHYGLIIDNAEDFKEAYRSIEDRECIWQECFYRYLDKPEEHGSFFIKDPSNNLIEFKWYKNREMVFG